MQDTEMTTHDVADVADIVDVIVSLQIEQWKKSSKSGHFYEIGLCIDTHFISFVSFRSNCTSKRTSYQYQSVIKILCQFN